MSRNITIRLETPEEITALIKQLRNLRKACAIRGGTRRVTFGDAQGRAVMFEACFEIGVDETPADERPATQPPRAQGELF